MAEDYKVRAIISAKDENMSSTFDHLYNQSGSLMERLKSGIGFGAMARIGSAAIDTLTSAIGDFAMSALEAGSSFEASMSEVSAISGATGAEIDALTEKAKEMGASTKFTATESSQALKYMAMAGWKTADMLGGLEGIMNLAAASGEDLATTSDIVTDALTAFGMKAEESGHFADILAAASSNANTNVSLLGESFKYVAPVAGSMGYSAEDVSLALGLMANSGIKASQAGTALRKVLNNITGDNASAQAALKQLGVSITDEAGQMKDLRTVLTDLRTAFSTLDAAQKASTASAIAGTTGMSGLLAIVNASEEDFNKLADSIDNCDGTAKRMATTMQDNLSGKITILGSAMEGLGIAAFEHLSTPFQQAVEIITQKVGVLTESMQNGKLGSIMESIGRGVKNAAKTAGQWFDFIVEHGQQVIGVASGIATAFASIRISRTIGATMSAFPGLIKGVTGSVSKMSSLMAVGVTRTDALLGVLEAGSGPLKGFAVKALDAGGGLKGLASAALGITTPLGAVAGVLALVAGGVTAWMVANQDLINENKKVLKQADRLKETYTDYSESLEQNREEREKQITTSSTEAMKAEQLAGKVQELAAKTNKSAAEKAYLKSMIDELNTVIPDLNLKYDEEKDCLDQTTEAINNKVEAMKREAQVASLRAAQDSVVTDMAEGERELAKAQGELSEMQDGLVSKQQELAELRKEWDSGNHSQEQANAIAKASEALSSQKKAVEETQKTVDGYTESLEGLQNEYDALGAKQQQITNKENWSSLVEEAKQAGIDIPANIQAGIDSGKMMVPASIDELNGLIDWDKFVQQATENGVEVPAGLARGIQEGTADPVQAAAYLHTILSDEFQGLDEQAKAHGFSIPEKMAAGIEAGSVDPQEAIDYVNQRIQEYEPAAEEYRTKYGKIPEEIANGINDGSMTVQEAVEALKAPIAFDDLSAAAATTGAQIPSYLAESIQNGALTPQQALTYMMESISGQLNRPELGQVSGQQLMDAYNAAIEGGATGSEAAASVIAQAVSGGLSSAASEANTTGSEIPQEASAGIEAGTSQVENAAKNMMEAGAKATEDTSAHRQNGSSNAKAYADGFVQKKGAATTAGSQVKAGSVTGTAGGYGPMFTNGSYNGQGYVNGIRSQASAAYEAGRFLGDKASQGARDATQVKSPSRVFMEIGSYVGQGFAMGIESTASEVAKATDEMISIPDAAMASLGSFSLPHGSFEQSSRDVTIEVPVELNGKVIAKGTASFMKEELERRERISIRVAGGR